MKKKLVGTLLAACLLTVPTLAACGGKTTGNGNTGGDGGNNDPTVECTHDWAEVDGGRAATCTEKGTAYFKCELCNNTKTVETEMLGHTAKDVFGCDEYEHWKTCTACNNVIPTTKQAHSGGTATYTDRAECEVCHTDYGALLTTDITMNDLKIPSGGFRRSSDAAVASTQNNSIAVKINGEFKLGTLSAKVTLNGVSSDNGIVFGVTNPTGLSQFWETGVSYYFFFVSRSGTAYLGKVTEGAWSVCGEAPIRDFDRNGTYELKVERNETGVKCYVNNALYVTYGEMIMLEGTEYGLRAGTSGIIFSELYCNSVGELPKLEEGNLKVVTGGTAGTAELAVTTKPDTLAFVDKKATEGTFSLNVITGASANAGLVFGMSDDGKDRYIFSVNTAAQRVELNRRKNGVSTALYSNYLSAGFSAGATYELKVVLTNGKAYAYFNNILYTVQTVDILGDNFGIYSNRIGSQFSGFSLTESEEVETCDTLLFGHSYFELWDDWKTDLKNVPDIGKYNNIGIGGSIAAHWNKMKDSVVAYNPRRIIYMIGINDLTGGVSASVVANNVETLLNALKAELPDLEAVLLSVNYCPAREHLRNEIVSTNALYKNICASNDWINYAEVLTAFCDDGVTPDEHWFKDGLHPSAEGYRKKLIPAVISAMRGENQPSYDPETAARELAAAKQIKKDNLLGYDENAYDPDRRAEAKAVYDRAIAAIDGCTTKEELNNIDLTLYTDRLKDIPDRAQAFATAMTSGENCLKFETPAFAAVINGSTGGKLTINGDGHRLYDINAAELSFTFRMTDLVGECSVGGILFRATRVGNGVSGYLINYVTENNYIQIWHCTEAYGGAANKLVYIGGWVFPDEVEDTLFRAIVENDTIYIYTEENYLALGKSGYGCSVPLDGSNVGQSLPVYRSGALGVLNWQGQSGAAVTYKLEIGLLSYKQTDEQAPSASDVRDASAIDVFANTKQTD